MITSRTRSKEEKKVTLVERLAIFIEWRQDPKYWYTLTQIADVVGIHIPSIAPTLSTLRRMGYVVSLKWVWSKQEYLYRIEKQSLKVLEKRVATAQR